MKKVIFFITLFFFTFIGVANASNLTIDIIDNNNFFKQLVFLEDGKKISFNEAKRKFNVDDYMSINEDVTYYFYKGNQISEKEYNDGLALIRTEKLVSEHGKFGIRVKSTNDIINKIDELYNERKNGTYYLIYSSIDYNNIDFNKIDEYISNKYVVDNNKNIFSYEEHGIYFYPKTLYKHDGDSYIINIGSIISKEEEAKTKEFTQEFLLDIKAKKDYEKIYLVYNYLKSTVNIDSKCLEKGKTNVSTYNTLIERKTCRVGLINTFQYLMEKLNIESYIYEDFSITGDTSTVNKIFNVVRLNGNYYIIDFIDNEEVFLVGSNDNLVLSNGIIVSTSPYNGVLIEYSIDNKKYDKLIETIKNDLKKHESLTVKKEDLKDVDLISYLILILILLLILGIILLFTRRGR